MFTKRKINLKESQIDSMREIASIGMSHAATALSKMIKHPVMIIVPQIDFVPTKELNKSFVSDKNDLFVGVFSKILGKMTGHLLVLFEKKSAVYLVDILLNKPIGSTKVFSELEQSCLMETGAIVTASCLNALAEFLKMVLIPSIPNFIFDYGEGISNHIIKELRNDYTFVLNSEFKSQEKDIKGKFFIFPDEDSINAIWKSFNIK